MTRLPSYSYDPWASGKPKRRNISKGFYHGGMDPKNSILKTVALSKRYGAFDALKSLNLSVGPGEVVGLLGPNGSGKTTALRLILGFLKPTSGNAMLGGHDSWTAGHLARAQVSYLPAELRLYDTMNGRQIVRWIASFRGELPDEARMERLGRLFELDLERPLGKLSSGMKRKVALLAVLLPRTPLLMLDEPTNALDPSMRDALVELVREARQSGQAVLFSSHILEEVDAVADRVVVLRKGELVMDRAMETLRGGVRIHLVVDETPEIPDHLVDQLRLIKSEKAGGCAIAAPALTPQVLTWLSTTRARELRVEQDGLRRALASIFPGGIQA